MEQAFNRAELKFFLHFRGYEVGTSLVKTEYGSSYDFLFPATLLKDRKTSLETVTGKKGQIGNKSNVGKVMSAQALK